VFANAIRKYGPDAFEHETLETAETLNEANEAEVRWISKLQTRVPHGYNLEAGGRCGQVHGDTRVICAVKKKQWWATLSEAERNVVLRNMTGSKTPESLRAAADKWHVTMTPERCSAAARLRWARMSEEQRKAVVTNIQASISPGALSEAQRKVWSERSREERLALYAKSQETRVRLYGPKKRKNEKIQRGDAWRTACSEAARRRIANSKETGAEWARRVNVMFSPEQRRQAGLKAAENYKRRLAAMSPEERAIRAFRLLDSQISARLKRSANAMARRLGYTSVLGEGV
jgi:hypothetical protein